MSAAAQIPSATLSAVASPAQTKPVDKPKPCCVCKEEKSARDECMLFSKSGNPEKDCAGTIEKYKSCMAGFGFNLP